jgi:hypothetical protein
MRTSDIPGADQVVQALGRWPSFHDAEVLAFTLSRGATPDDRVSDARLDVHVRDYESRNEGTAEYEVVLVKSVVIRFVFSGVENLEIDDFNFQNVIDALTISGVQGEHGEELHVDVESIYGFGGRWLCRSARVESVHDLGTSPARRG